MAEEEEKEKKTEEDPVIKAFKSTKYERPKPRETLDYKGAAKYGIEKEKKKKAAAAGAED